MKYPLASKEFESVTAQVTSLAHDLAEVKVKIDESLSHDMIKLRKQLR